jgi:hypothetical protein
VKTTHKIAALLAAGLMLGVAAGCKKDKDGDAGEAAKSVKGDKPAGGGASGAKAKALEDAWKASADCQRLVACCAAAPGSSHAQSLSIVCKQVDDIQDFEKQASNLVDAAWQDNLCKNMSDSIAQLGNASNPVPEACRK